MRSPNSWARSTGISTWLVDGLKHLGLDCHGIGEEGATLAVLGPVLMDSKKHKVVLAVYTMS